MSSSGRGGRHRSFLTMTLFAVFAAIVVGTVLWQSIQLSSFESAVQRVNAVKPWATAVRLCAIAALACAWARLSPGSAVIDAGSAAIARARWMALRWRVIGLLLLIELLLCHGLFRALVASLVGSP